MLSILYTLILAKLFLKRPKDISPIGARDFLRLEIYIESPIVTKGKQNSEGAARPFTD